jgi:ACT domain-containing protein
MILMMGSSQPQTTESTTVTIQISMKTTSNLCKEIMEQMKSFTNVDDYEYNVDDSTSAK